MSLIAYEWRQWEKSQQKVMFLFELLVALSILFTREGGVECWDLGGWWGCSVIGSSQGLSFCHVVSFFISGLIFHWRASSIHLNLLFLALRKLMNFEYL